MFAGTDDPKEEAFRNILGPKIEIFGWTEAYARISGKATDQTSVGTVEYARMFGKTGITLECGQHNDPVAVDVAFAAVLNALDFLGISPDKGKLPLNQEPVLRLKLEGVYWRTDNGRLAKNWKHLEMVKRGEALAFKANGETISAPDDGYVLLPRIDCPIGDEWFYFGIR